nr:hypothetical protein [Bradyrhizobium mercantei]
MKVKHVPPASCSSSGSTVVFVGRNRRGNWVARERNGLFGGLFVDRAQALKYALLEISHRRESVIEVSGTIELDVPLIRRRLTKGA